MKNGKKILCGLALSAMMMIGQNAFAQAGSTPCFDITYDGYCDGASFCVNPKSGTSSGVQTGCETGDMLGTVGQIWGQGTGVTMGYTSTADYADLVTVIRQDGTWIHYGNDGSGIYVVNSGTWSAGSPALTAGGESSTGK